MLDPAGQSQRKTTVWNSLAIILLIGAAGLIGVYFVLNSISSRKTKSDTSDGLLVSENAAANTLLAPTVGATSTPVPSPTPQPFIVYISGAVTQPGVYAVQQDARVIDVVTAAGGLSPEANSEQINLAAHLHDAQHIHVPRLGETPQALPDTSPAAEQSAASADGPSAPDGADGADGLDGPSAPININTASAAELQTLPGIGEVMAQRIVDYRNATGSFASVEDLQNVRGIGPVLLEKIRPQVQVGEE
jgi:competence protein ComEA